MRNKKAVMTSIVVALGATALFSAPALAADRPAPQGPISFDHWPKPGDIRTVATRPVYAEIAALRSGGNSLIAWMSSGNSLAALRMAGRSTASADPSATASSLRVSANGSTGDSANRLRIAGNLQIAQVPRRGESNDQFIERRERDRREGIRDNNSFYNFFLVTIQDPLLSYQAEQRTKGGTAKDDGSLVAPTGGSGVTPLKPNPASESPSADTPSSESLWGNKPYGVSITLPDGSPLIVTHFDEETGEAVLSEGSGPNSGEPLNSGTASPPVTDDTQSAAGNAGADRGDSNRGARGEREIFVEIDTGSNLENASIQVSPDDPRSDQEIVTRYFHAYPYLNPGPTRNLRYQPLGGNEGAGRGVSNSRARGKREIFVEIVTGSDLKDAWIQVSPDDPRFDQEIVADWFNAHPYLDPGPTRNLRYQPLGTSQSGETQSAAGQNGASGCSGADCPAANYPAFPEDNGSCVGPSCSDGTTSSTAASNGSCLDRGCRLGYVPQSPVIPASCTGADCNQPPIISANCTGNGCTYGGASLVYAVGAAGFSPEQPGGAGGGTRHYGDPRYIQANFFNETLGPNADPGADTTTIYDAIGQALGPDATPQDVDAIANAIDGGIVNAVVNNALNLAGSGIVPGLPAGAGAASIFNLGVEFNVTAGATYTVTGFLTAGTSFDVRLLDSFNPVVVTPNGTPIDFVFDLGNSNNCSVRNTDADAVSGFLLLQRAGAPDIRVNFSNIPGGGGLGNNVNGV